MSPKPPTNDNDEDFRTVADAMAAAPPLPDDAPELTDAEMEEIEAEIVAEIDEAVANLKPARPDINPTKPDTEMEEIEAEIVAEIDEAVANLKPARPDINPTKPDEPDLPF